MPKSTRAVRVDNERKACDAVVRVLERRSRNCRSNEWSPEDRNIEPPVEYIFGLAGLTYAIEHTVIEAFDRQIRTGVDFGTFIAPILNALDHQLPRPGVHRLTFGINPSGGLRPRAIVRAQAAIIDWVRIAAAQMHDECPTVPTRSQRPYGHEGRRIATVDGIALHLHSEVHWSHSGKHDGRLFCGRFAPANYEGLRLERMHAALEKKLPKLNDWRRRGARSILILENRDIALSRPNLIFEAAEQALGARGDSPDELWLVDTTTENPWTVWCLYRDGVPFPDEETPERYTDFDPLSLVPVPAH